MAENGEFTPITSQEAFDAAIAARLQRERTNAVKPYADYDAIKKERDDLAAAGATKDAQLAEAQEKIKRYETGSVKTRIAHEKGLPFEMADRLTGETEEEISADADRLAKIIGGVHEPAPPLADPEQNKATGLDAALQSLAADLNK